MEQTIAKQAFDLAAYITPFLNWGLLIFLFGYTWRSMAKIRDTKVEKETCKVVEGKVNEKLDEMKVQNGKLHKKIDEQQQKITEMSTDIKWIVGAIKSNGGVNNG